MAARIQLDEDTKHRLLQPELLPASVEVNGKVYTPEVPIAAGYKGAVWRVRDEFGRMRALKLCIYDDYQDRSYLEELSRASVLEPYPQFAGFVDAGLAEIELEDLPKRTFVSFVEEWIDGLPLDTFVKERNELVTTSLLLGYVRGLCEALNALREVGLMHDDLHAGNVMLARPIPGTLSSEWTIKIVDAGSMKPADRPSSKAKDDHRHFVDHLVLLWNAVRARRALAGRDRRFLAEASRLLGSMLDDEPSIALRDPGQVVAQFELAYTRASKTRPERDASTSVSDPFEFISAEHIADDRLLVEIFARSCPFLAKVDGPDPCLVTGPRGCGKSTIFRWLSLKAHMHQSVAEIDSLRIAGFYISCGSDMQNRLGWIRTSALADRFRREIVHYFNLLLTREIVHTIGLIGLRDDRTSYWGLGESQEQRVCQFLFSAVGKPTYPRVQGVSRISQVAEMVEDELFSTHDRMLRGLNAKFWTSEAFLGDLTSLLVREVPFFATKRIAFLIDDFSLHRLPHDVQRVLNQVIWERRASHVFKLSSEKDGAVLTDTFGATMEVTREILEIDCGREYIALDDSNQVKRARAFATELLDNRLKAASYKGTAETLIGHSSWEEGSLGRALAQRREGRVDDHYHGLECIADLCSGDVSTLLLVYRRIFERGAVSIDSSKTIPKKTQHEAIVSVSRELFEAIKHLFPAGAAMYGVVAAFGVLVRNILQHGKWQRKGTTTVPSQCPRIELDQKHGAAMDALSDEQQDLCRELVRRAIFIEMEPGLSRHRNLTTLRWHLRRVFLPSFHAALAKNDAVKEPVDWLKYFLTNPQSACQMVWRRWPKTNPEADESNVALLGLRGNPEGRRHCLVWRQTLRDLAVERTKMPKIVNVELVDVISDLADIVPFDPKECSSFEPEDIFFCALGFEPRCLVLPGELRAGGYRARRCCYFRYATNLDDNAVNQAQLDRSLAAIAPDVLPMESDDSEFPNRLRDLLKIVTSETSHDSPRVTVDVSVMANRLLLRCIKVLLDYNANVRVVYSEANSYRPTKTEYEQYVERSDGEPVPALEHGVGDVMPSVDHPGIALDLLPDAVILFPNFRGERSNAVISFVDPSLVTNPGGKVVWILGIPHLGRRLLAT